MNHPEVVSVVIRPTIVQLLTPRWCNALLKGQLPDTISPIVSTDALSVKFHFEQVIHLPRKTVFGFFENPECLELLHAGWSDVRLLKHETQLRVGGETWVEHTVAGLVPVVLGFRHTMFEAPLRFSEELIHGPFTHFHHLHEFEDEAGKTRIRDTLNVDWPWQFGGELVLNLLLRPSITKLFASRAQAMERLARDGTIERCAAQHRIGPAS